MPSERFAFLVHDERLAIAHLAADADLPAWAGGPWLALVRTPDELSVICAQERVPPGVKHERERIALGVEGTVPMTAIGVLAGLCTTLAQASVPVFVVSTYRTDWLLVAAEHFDAARAALVAAGHRVYGERP
jgi:hypothetical protein